MFGLGSSIGSPIGWISFAVVARLGISGEVFDCNFGAKFGSNARPMLVAQASATMHIKTNDAIFVAFIPPCQFIPYVDVLFLFSATWLHGNEKIAKVHENMALFERLMTKVWR